MGYVSSRDQDPTSGYATTFGKLLTIDAGTIGIGGGTEQTVKGDGISRRRLGLALPCFRIAQDGHATEQKYNGIPISSGGFVTFTTQMAGLGEDEYFTKIRANKEFSLYACSIPGGISPPVLVTFTV